MTEPSDRHVRDEDLAAVIEATKTKLPEKLEAWPGGWPNQIEAALIDAVLSIRAHYGSANSGVRAAVRRYREAVGDETPDSLSRLADFEPAKLAEVLRNHQFTGGAQKAVAIVMAAQNLLQAGAATAADVTSENPGLEKAYTSVPGLGPVTWEYFTMLLGRPGVKADIWITRFVREAVGHDVTAREAGSLVHAAAEKLNVNASQLDHAIWTHMRRN